MRWWLASAVVEVAAVAALGCAAEEVEGRQPGVGTGATSGSGGGTGMGAVGIGTGGGLVIVTPPDTGEPTQPCDGTLTVTIRDFSEAHPDFEQEVSSGDVRRGVVDGYLGADRKPVFINPTGCIYSPESVLECDPTKPIPTTPTVASQATFDQWYRDVPDVNFTFERRLPLAETAPGSGIYLYESSAFFPLEPTEGWGPTPISAKNAAGLNYLFTTEVHVTFTYEAGQRFTFRGDDDLWIFVNGILALDLGGTHFPREGMIDFDAQASRLNIEAGVEYPLDIFHAERQTTMSNFRVETNIHCFKEAILR